MTLFANMWKYEINPKYKDDFLKAYSSDGEWAKLFSQTKGYQMTILLEDQRNSKKYITIDFWDSKEVNEKFKERFREQYQHLDDKCEQYTIREVHLGDYYLQSPDKIKNVI